MRFDRTRESMEVLERRKDISVYDALNVFYDLCQDVKDSGGGSVDKQALGGGDDAVLRVCWACQMMLKIVKKNREEVSDPSRAERLDKMEAQLQALQGDLTQAEQNIKTLSAQDQMLSQKKEAIEEKRRQETELTKKCEALRQQIQSFETAKLPELSSQYEALSEKAADYRKQYEEKQKAARKLQESLIREKAQVQQTDEENKKLQTAIKEEKEKNSKLQAKHYELDQQLQHCDDNQKELLEKITDLNRQLRAMNVDGLQQLYKEKQAEYAAKLKEYKQEEIKVRQEETKIDEMEEQLSRLKQDLSGKTKRTQEMAWEMENEKAKLEEELKGLTKRINEARDRRNALTIEVEKKKDEVEAQEEWFKSLEVKNYEKQLQACSQRLQIFINARNALEYEMNLGALPQGSQSDNTLLYFQKYYRDQLDQIEKELNQYQERYNMVINAFYK